MGLLRKLFGGQTMAALTVGTEGSRLHPEINRGQRILVERTTGARASGARIL